MYRSPSRSMTSTSPRCSSVPCSASCRESPRRSPLPSVSSAAGRRAIPAVASASRLSTTPLRRGDWAPGVSSPQLVAFATDDAIACAKAMRERGAPILEMPGNYYDDLDARLSLPAELVESLREHSILYDRDEQGEFLHFFTEMLGSRVFFEVVQRIGGYAALRRPPQHPVAHGGAPPSAASHAGERADRVLGRASARLFARPPDRTEPVASGAGGCRCRRRLPLRGPAHDQGHRGGAPLPADLRPGTHAGHQDTPRGDGHRGARHRARAIHAPETARATICGSWRRAPSSALVMSSRSSRTRISHARPIDSPSCAGWRCHSA